MSDDWKFLPEQDNTIQTSEHLIAFLPGPDNVAAHPDGAKHGELIARAPRLRDELTNLLQQVSHLEKEADYDFSSARKLLAELNPPSETRTLPEGLPKLEDLAIDATFKQIDFDCEYVDYTFWIDKVDGRDWKFIIAYEMEHGRWLDIRYEDSAPDEAFEESDIEEVPAVIVAAAESLLKQCKEFKK